jgi:hypothetical protein
MTLVRHDGLTQSFHEIEVTMRESPALSPIALELLRWCADDFTELFAVRQIVKRELAVDDPQRERQAALSALDELITLDLISVRDEAAAEASTWDESATRTRTQTHCRVGVLSSEHGRRPVALRDRVGSGR